MERRIWIFLVVLLLGALGLLLIPKETETPARPVFSAQIVQTQTLTPTENQVISLPYSPEGWGLVVEGCICYDGPYMEDGTNAPVENVAGAILRNDSDRGISFAVLALEQGDKITYFTVTWLPPGQRVLVLAMDRGAYDPQPVTDCRVLGIRWDDFSSAPVEVLPGPEGSLQVTNLMVTRQEGICLRFKQYSEDYGMLLGGITQCVSIPVLMPREACLICPDGLDPENARLVAKVK